jgi:outer membrane lipoprotein SlyB
VGALAGGRKGALIGAAIGGGAGTLYEIVKH